VVLYERTRPLSLCKNVDFGTRPSFLVNRRELRDAASKASHAILLKDHVGSFNAKSALTVGDLCYWCFPERRSTYQLRIGFDVRAGIKADGFDCYAINYKPYGLHINRPQPL